jgi:hypothetical protein
MTQSVKGLKFVMTEDANSKLVRAVLEVDGLRILEFENQSAPRVKVRHPKANEKELLEMAEYWSQPKQAYERSPAAVLDRYIDSRYGDIAKHMLEVRKAVRKMAGAARNARIAKKAKKSLGK